MKRLPLTERLLAGDVTRFHTRPVITTETVAVHTYRIMVLADEVYEGKTPQHIMRYLLLHDVAEFHIGDIPYPVKQHLGSKIRKLEHEANLALGIALPELTDNEYAIVKSLDMLAFVYYMRLEQTMGNLLNLDRLSVANGAVKKFIMEVTEYKYADRLNKIRLQILG